MVTPQTWIKRHIEHIQIDFEQKEKFELATIVFRWRDESMNFVMNTQGFLVWRAVPGGEIELTNHDVLSISIEPASIECARIQVICFDRPKKDEPPIEVIEQYKFLHGEQIATTQSFMHPDNSLEARRERKRLREIAEQNPVTLDDIEWDT